MAKQLKSKKPITQDSKAEIKIHRYLIAFPVIAFIIKLITIFNIGTGIWLGADGDNYIKGVDGLYADGLFSKADILNYWPAGYPILLWLLVLISVSKTFYLLSIVQSIFFAYATYFLTRNISKTSAAWLAFSASFIISFNPTLSLSTLAVGYEAPVAASFMMVLGVIIVGRLNPEKPQYKYAIYAGAWIALASFMQPRYLLAGFVVILIWGATFLSRKSAIKVISIGFAVALLSPILLIARNDVAINQRSISTNLGVTMAIGAGDETLGGYQRTGPEVPCSPSTPNGVVTDNQRVKCVIKWYLTNPIKTAKLAFYKSKFFWSPWSGPVGNGTMGRNPWLKISPAQNISKTQSGYDLVSGLLGKTISWLWIIGQIAFLFYGFLVLRKGDQISRLIGNSALSAVVIAWLISIGTVGDHRFRVPTMSLSLLLQGAGMLKMSKKISKALSHR
jgi:hypothetical protein